MVYRDMETRQTRKRENFFSYFASVGLKPVKPLVYSHIREAQEVGSGPERCPVSGPDTVH